MVLTNSIKSSDDTKLNNNYNTKFSRIKIFFDKYLGTVLIIIMIISFLLIVYHLIELYSNNNDNIMIYPTTTTACTTNTDMMKISSYDRHPIKLSNFYNKKYSDAKIFEELQSNPNLNTTLSVPLTSIPSNIVPISSLSSDYTRYTVMPYSPHI